MSYVVHCKKEPFDVYIGRNKTGLGDWGNPFPLKDPKNEEDRIAVVEQYREWVIKQPHLMNNLWQLREKKLGCWCAPRACHGDVLSYLANDTPGTLRLIIAGSRSFDDYPLLCRVIDEIAKQYNDLIIIEGEAKGADLLGRRYAEEHGYMFIPMPAMWDEEGKKAGYVRNENMAKIANGAVLFWDGVSKGTKSMKALAKKYKLKTKVVLF